MTRRLLLMLSWLFFLSLGIGATTPDQPDKHTVDRSSATIPTPIHGITVADNSDIRKTAYLNKVIESVSNLNSTPTVRLTYKLEGSNHNKGAKASTYLSATKAMSKKSYIFAEVLDSAYEFCFDVADHEARWNDYVSTLGDYVDIWEVGNEITVTGSIIPIRSQ